MRSYYVSTVFGIKAVKSGCRMYRSLLVRLGALCVISVLGSTEIQLLVTSGLWSVRVWDLIHTLLSFEVKTA